MIGSAETGIRQLRRWLSRNEWIVRLFGLESFDDQVGDQAEQGKGAPPWQEGLVLIQIDGLSRVEFERAIQQGEMPFLSRLLNKEHYELHSLYSGLPSSTPSVQGELFYGVRTAVPAFAYLDRRSGEAHRMYEPESAEAIERKLALQGESLLAGGSAYSDIYTGGAAESHFCMSSMGWSELLKEVRPRAWLIATVLHLPMLVRAIALVGVELVLAIIDAVRGVINGRSLLAEIKFVVSRVAISILLRDLITIGAEMDIIRGLPVIHLNYLGYDEQAHRRGPDSAFAHWTLKGIDRSIERLWSASHQARHRHYDIWVYSDHGQESTIPYVQLAGKTIEQAVREALSVRHPDTAARLQSLNERIAERRGHLVGGRWLQYLMPDELINGDLSIGRSAGDLSEHPAVVAMGPVGHVYLDDRSRASSSLAELAMHLVDHGQVPGVLFLDEEGLIHGRVRSGAITLPGDSVQLLGADHPYREEVIVDLAALLKHPDAGDLVLLGCVAGVPAVSFPLENGSHAGAGPLETGAFALLPRDVVGLPSRGRSLRPLGLRQAALELLRRAPTASTSNVQSQARSRTRASRQPRRIRVMSYNVHSCMGMDSRIAPERIARVIARYRPDVVALQEVDVGKQRTYSVDQAELIAQHLEMEVDFHPAMQMEEEEYGDAILTHLPILRARTGSLGPVPTRPGGEPRGIQWLTLDIDGLEVQILNTHLGLFTAERKVQVEELMSERWLGNVDCQGPTILCGDFNATPRSPAMLTLKGELTDVQDLTAAKRLNTFAGRLPTLCIDHVLVRHIEGVSSVFVPNTELTRLASDHLPLVVDITLRSH